MYTTHRKGLHQEIKIYFYRRWNNVQFTANLTFPTNGAINAIFCPLL